MACQGLSGRVAVVECLYRGIAAPSALRLLPDLSRRGVLKPVLSAVRPWAAAPYRAQGTTQRAGRILGALELCWCRRASCVPLRSRY